MSRRSVFTEDHADGPLAADPPSNLHPTTWWDAAAATATVCHDEGPDRTGKDADGSWIAGGFLRRPGRSHGSRTAVCSNSHLLQDSAAM